MPEQTSGTSFFDDVDGIRTSFHRSFNDDDRDTMNVESSISAFFEECSASCTAPHERRMSNSCCRGGLSSLKLTYHGPNGSLLVPDDPSLKALIKIDPCNEYRRLSGGANEAPDSIRFASCDRCFPASNDDCDITLDVATVQDVSSGDMICLVRVDDVSNHILPNTKFPSIMDLYFVVPEDDDFVVATSIRTSCSSAIYAPFGVRVGQCSDNSDFYVTDLSTTSLAEGESVLEFVDGSSSCHSETSFSDCFATTPSSPSHPSADDSCCEGGASFIKVRLIGGQDIAGFLTIDSEIVASSMDCDDLAFGSLGRVNSRKTNSSSRVRFVDCSDECLLQGFDVDCTTVKTSIDGIGTGVEFCVVSFHDGAVSLAERLPTTFGLWFIPESNAIVHSLLMHSSCSKPFLGYGQTFGFECDGSDSTSVDISQEQPDENLIFVEFVDGFSDGYFKARQKLDKSASSFDISFSGCGCACEQVGAPSPPNGDAPFLLSASPSGVSSPPSKFPNSKTSTLPSEHSDSTPFGSMPPHVKNSDSPVASKMPLGPRIPGRGKKAATPGAFPERPSRPPSLVPSVMNIATSTSPSNEPTNPRRPGPGRGKKATTPNESLERPSLMPFAEKGTPSASPSFESTSPRRPGPGRGKKATTPSESLERLSYHPSLMPSAKNDITSNSPSYEPTGQRRPGFGRGKKSVTPNHTLERSSRRPSLMPFPTKGFPSASPSYVSTQPRQPGPGRGKKATTPNEPLERPSRRRSFMPSTIKDVASSSPSYESTSPHRPGTGHGKKVSTPRPSVKPSALVVPHPCPAKTPPPLEVDSFNPSSAEPTSQVVPSSSQARTSFPTDVLSLHPTTPPSLEPTAHRNPGPRPVPGKTASPNALLPTNPSSPAITPPPVQIRTSSPSLEPTTPRNPGPRPWPAVTSSPNASHPPRPSNSTYAPNPVLVRTSSPADGRPTSPPSLEPTTPRNPGPRPGAGKTASPNAWRPPRPSNSTSTPNPVQIITSSPANGRRTIPPSLEPTTPRNHGPGPWPAVTSSPNALRPPRPSNSTNTPNPFQKRTSSPTGVRPTSPPSLEPTTPRNPGPRPWPAVTSSPNASRPPRPSNSTYAPNPVLVRTSSPADGRPTSPPSLEPTTPRNPGPRPGAGKTASPNAWRPPRPSNSTKTPNPVQIITSSPANGRRTIPPSLEPTTPRNPGTGPWPAVTSSPNALRPPRPSNSTNTTNPFQKRTSSPADSRPTSPPSLEPTTQRNPGPRPGPGTTPLPSALFPSLPTKPSVEFTPLPSLHPSVPIMPSSLPGPIDCNILCEQWVLENCVVVGDDGEPLPGFPCDVSSSINVDGGRRLGNVDADIAFHENMIAMYSRLLRSIQ
ncbi:hypothetical protein MHU86_2671 [Fragilaria crotonensis]|nr:hypothetical protein MHU86_2671 [Fragilaria crotonensis]